MDAFDTKIYKMRKEIDSDNKKGNGSKNERNSKTAEKSFSVINNLIKVERNVNTDDEIEV